MHLFLLFYGTPLKFSSFFCQKGDEHISNILNQIDSVGVKTVFFVSDLQSAKHGFTVLGNIRFTDQNIKQCDHIQHENCLCDKSNDSQFIDIQRLPTKSSDYSFYKVKDNLPKTNMCSQDLLFYCNQNFADSTTLSLCFFQ